MIVTYNWLKEFIDFDFSVEELAHKITMLGLEVDSIEKIDGDYVIDVDLTPNKADSLSVYGIAREISLLVQNNLKGIDVDISRYPKTSNKPNITILAKKLCRRYSSVIIENIKVQESPDEIKQKLEACGIRPINNIVDATNYVLLEMGQPLHAFDLDRLKDKKIVVRTAKQNEKLMTLDEQEKTLSEQHLVIADGERAVALAGIMGGANSEINEKSNNILLESAYFDPISIRKTARQLGYHTDASHRFERGTDYNITVKALLRTAEIILQQYPDAKISEVTDVYPEPISQPIIQYRNDRYKKIVGVGVEFQTAVNVLKKIGMDIVEINETDEILRAVAPSFRPDLKLEIDLIEEIVRVIGYDQVPSEIPSISPSSNSLYDQFNQEFDVTNFVRQFLINCQLKEIINYTFESSEFNEKLGISAHVLNVSNPLDRNQNILRPSLMQGFLKVLKHNYRFLNKNLSVFELGNVFSLENKKMIQTQKLGILLTGQKNNLHFSDENRMFDFFDMKGIVEALLEKFNLKNVIFKSNHFSFLHKGRSATILTEDKPIGFLGQLDYYKSDWLEFDLPVFLCELDLSFLIKQNIKPFQFQTFKNINIVRRDLSILVPENVPFIDVMKSLKTKNFITSINLINIYKGDKIEPGFVSQTYALDLISPEQKQLTDDDINKFLQDLLQSLDKDVNAKLR